MALDVKPEILAGLIRVDLPRLERDRDPVEMLKVGHRSLPVYRARALVLGSGAAGLRAAVELARRGLDVLVATASPHGGTSACSGSDKQTLHTATTGAHGDDFLELVRDLATGGCMDHDTAYVEAVGSVGALAGLPYLGLPLPWDWPRLPVGTAWPWQTCGGRLKRA